MLVKLYGSLLYRYTERVKTGHKMKSFQQYLLEREQASPTDAFGGGVGLGNIETPSSDDSLMHIAKIAVDDHRTDTLSFFKHLATKDGRIEHELSDYHSSRKHGVRPKNMKGPPEHDTDNRDEVVPNSADSQGGVEGSEGG